MIPMTMLWIMLLGTVGYLKPTIQKIISWVIVVLLVIVGLTMIINGVSTLK